MLYTSCRLPQAQHWRHAAYSYPSLFIMQKTRQTTMKIKHLTAIFFTSLVLGISCNSTTKIADKNTNKLDFNWQALSDTAKYSVTYIQLNFINYPTDETIGKDIFDIQDYKDGKKMKLTNKQEFNLFKLVTDTTDFSEGECGTFQLNAGFIIYQGDKSVGKINVGCGYSQWNFQPDNYQSKWGVLNDKGFSKMEKLLDDINLTNK